MTEGECKFGRRISTDLPRYDGDRNQTFSDTFEYRGRFTRDENANNRACVPGGITQASELKFEYERFRDLNKKTSTDLSKMEEDIPISSRYIFWNARASRYRKIYRMQDSRSEFITNYNSHILGSKTEKLLEIKYNHSHIGITDTDIENLRRMFSFIKNIQIIKYPDSIIIEDNDLNYFIFINYKEYLEYGIINAVCDEHLHSKKYRFMIYWDFSFSSDKDSRKMEIKNYISESYSINVEVYSLCDTIDRELRNYEFGQGSVETVIRKINEFNGM